ncbi:MAG: hypothetical protein FWG31_05455 [Oscillospiraceae bacterium]|nr:hypothetical protein [Oscillospiraceae bacterium]
MPEKGLIPAAAAAVGVDKQSIKEAVCVHTQKIYDACRDKDCLEDLRIYFTEHGQHTIDRAVGLKCRRAELIWCSLDVESVAFNRGFYSVDVRYFYSVTVEVNTGAGRPCEVTGLAVFDKRVILFGSEGNAKIFSSNEAFCGAAKSHLPTAVIEAVDPICLNIKMTECHEQQAVYGCGLHEVPDAVIDYFDGDLVLEGGEKRVYCTLGQFS